MRWGIYGTKEGWLWISKYDDPDSQRLVRELAQRNLGSDYQVREYDIACRYWGHDC